MTNKIAIIRQTGVLETKLAKLQADINSIDATPWFFSLSLR
jgi:hypothetical protein